MADKIGALDTAMDAVRSPGVSSAGCHWDMGDVVLVEV